MRVFVFFLLIIVSCSPLKKYEDTDAKWENEIVKLENLDSSQDYTKNQILFIGSSSIRLWKSIKKDLEPYQSIKRAYGGARYTDLIHFTERLVSPHNIKAVGIFVANDITGGENDLSPKEVLKLAKYVVKQIRTSHKSSSVFFIETTPTPKRWKAWSKISQANDFGFIFSTLFFNSLASSTLPFLNNSPICFDKLLTSESKASNFVCCFFLFSLKSIIFFKSEE